MSKHLSFMFALTAVAVFQAGCAEPDPAAEADEAIEQVYAGKLTVAQAQTNCRCKLEIVPVGGTVFHFGLDLSQSPPAPYPFQSTVAGARVSIAELPITRRLNLRSDADGKWGFKAIKLKGVPLRMSFVYELAGYPTTKSPGRRDHRRRHHRPGGPVSDPGVLRRRQGADRTADRRRSSARPTRLSNVLVTTVGKSWASMYSAELPHGDPGVQVAISPAIQFPVSLGPVYFNEQVSPDPTLTSTSVDGGVLFGNLATGSHTITASKAPFSYDALTFVVQDGIELYVASPPHATQGTNDSPPGQP